MTIKKQQQQNGVLLKDVILYITNHLLLLLLYTNTFPQNSVFKKINNSNTYKTVFSRAFLIFMAVNNNQMRNGGPKCTYIADRLIDK